MSLTKRNRGPDLPTPVWSSPCYTASRIPLTKWFPVSVWQKLASFTINWNIIICHCVGFFSLKRLMWVSMDKSSEIRILRKMPWQPPSLLSPSSWVPSTTLFPLGEWHLRPCVCQVVCSNYPQPPFEFKRRLAVLLWIGECAWLLRVYRLQEGLKPSLLYTLENISKALQHEEI